MGNDKNAGRHEMPSIEQLETELDRVNYKSKYKKVFKSTLFTLIVVAAIAVLVAVLLMPVLRIYGTSMTPTLTEGDIVVSIRTENIKFGDIVGVYYGRKLLIKRCIATEGQWVDIDADGNVFVDGVLLDEPYVVEKSLGKCNIELPYQVPTNMIFVMGDHRDTSVDSRNTSVGCIEKENIVGKIVFRVWPFNKFSSVS